MRKSEGHALSTPFGALKHDDDQARELGGEIGACPLNALRGTETVDHRLPARERVRGHALSTPFGALKLDAIVADLSTLKGACPLNALRGTETLDRALARP